jgi:hypothetical protein
MLTAVVSVIGEMAAAPPWRPLVQGNAGAVSPAPLDLTVKVRAIATMHKIPITTAVMTLMIARFLMSLLAPEAC